MGVPSVPSMSVDFSRSGMGTCIRKGDRQADIVAFGTSGLRAVAFGLPDNMGLMGIAANGADTTKTDMRVDKNARFCLATPLSRTRDIDTAFSSQVGKDVSGRCSTCGVMAKSKARSLTLIFNRNIKGRGCISFGMA